MYTNHNKLSVKIPVVLLAASLGLAACSKSGEVSAEQSPTPSVAASESAQATQKPAKVAQVAKATGKILFAGETPNGKHDIYERNLATGKVANLTNTPNTDELNPQLSPDGKHVVMASDATGTYQIYRFNLADPKHIKRLTNDGASDFDPTYAPDGDILYKSNKDDGYGDIWGMDGNGNSQRNLTPSMNQTEEWKPTAVSNTEFVFTSQHADDGSMSRAQLSNTSELMLVNTANGAAPTKLTSNDYPDWYSESNPSQPGVIAYTSKLPSDPTGHDVIMQMNVTKPANTEILVDLPGDSSDCSWVPGAAGALLFANNAVGHYEAFARTSDGDIYELPSLSDGADVLSPIAGAAISVR